MTVQSRHEGEKETRERRERPDLTKKQTNKVLNIYSIDDTF